MSFCPYLTEYISALAVATSFHSCYPQLKIAFPKLNTTNGQKRLEKVEIWMESAHAQTRKKMKTSLQQHSDVVQSESRDSNPTLVSYSTLMS